LFVQNNEKIVQAILNLGESLGIKVVAEGVETAEQREFFVGKGCFAVQGYYFYRPVPAVDALGLLVGKPA
nr:EAL domain-containing protein [Spirochaeta sp.]